MTSTEAATPRDAVTQYWQSVADVPGWLEPMDFLVLQLVDQMQEEAGVVGDILEIGVYQGRTAILLQYFCRGREGLTVCDVFEEPTDDAESEEERAAFYTDLTRGSFEAHFRRYHGRLPEIHSCPSQELGPRIAGRAFRLAHVDGSHVHAIVRDDLALVRTVIAPGGVVAVDDYRREHTPGVAAAVWEQVAVGGLQPFCLTAGRLYGCWQGHERYVDRLRGLAAANPAFRIEEQVVAGRSLLRLSDASIEGPSREEFLAGRLGALQGEHAASLEASRRAAESAQAAIQAKAAELDSCRGRLHVAEQEIETGAVELAKETLRKDDLALRVSLLESASGIPSSVDRAR